MEDSMEELSKLDQELGRYDYDVSKTNVSIQKMSVYKTSDGEIFELETEAITHQNKLDIEDVIFNGEFLTYGELRFPRASDLIEFLIEHKDSIMKLYV
jgi:hypothetical protein